MQSKFALVLWKFLEQVPHQSTDRGTRKDFPAMKILDISGNFGETQLKNIYPLGLAWRNSFKTGRPSILK